MPLLAPKVPVEPGGGFRLHRLLVHGANEGVVTAVSEVLMQLTGPESPCRMKRSADSIKARPMPAAASARAAGCTEPGERWQCKRAPMRALCGHLRLAPSFPAHGCGSWNGTPVSAASSPGFRARARRDRWDLRGKSVSSAPGGRVSGKHHAFCPRRRWAGQDDRIQRFILDGINVFEPGEPARAL